MNAAEKEIIYDFLKKASGAVAGYTCENFLGEMDFRDDEICANEIPQNANPSSAQISDEANSAQDAQNFSDAQNIAKRSIQSQKKFLRAKTASSQRRAKTRCQAKAFRIPRCL